MRSSVIVDIDGTIADCTHRLKYIKGKEKDWDSFHGKVTGDEPIRPVIDMINGLGKAGYYIIMMTGRPSVARNNTRWWLNKVAGCRWDMLLMRESGDHRLDVDVKLEWLDKLEDGRITIENVHPPKIAFEDRARMTKAFRERGIHVMHVDEGDF